MVNELNKSLSRVAEGIGPMKPGNLIALCEKGAKSYGRDSPKDEVFK